VNGEDGSVDLADFLSPAGLAILVQFARDLANVEATMNATDEQIAAVHALVAALDDPA
jgi:hypothetical protein